MRLVRGEWWGGRGGSSCWGTSGERGRASIADEGGRGGRSQGLDVELLAEEGKMGKMLHCG